MTAAGKLKQESLAGNILRLTPSVELVESVMVLEMELLRTSRVKIDYL